MDQDRGAALPVRAARAAAMSARARSRRPRARRAVEGAAARGVRGGAPDVGPGARRRSSTCSGPGFRARACSTSTPGAAPSASRRVSRGAARAVLVEPDAAALRRALERLGAGREEVRGGRRRRPAGPLPTLAAGGGAVRHRLRRPALRRRRRRAAIWPAWPGSSRDGGVLVVQARRRSSESPRCRASRSASRRAYGRNVFLFFGML